MIRRSMALGVFMYAGSLALLIRVAMATGIATAEVARLHAVGVGADCVRDWLGHGMHAEARCQLARDFAPLGPSGTLVSLFSGYIDASLGHALGAGHELLAARLGALMIAALAPGLVYLLARRSLGERAGAFAAILFAFCPPWLHAAATCEPDALLISASLVVLYGHTRALSARGTGRSWCPFAAAISIIGFAIATSISPGGAFPLMLIMPLHFVWTKWRTERPLLARGQVALPAHAVCAILAGALLFVPLSPWTWGDIAERLRALVLGLFTQQIAPTYYRGRLLSTEPVPFEYTLQWLALRLPPSTLLLAIFGVIPLALNAIRDRLSLRAGPTHGVQDRQACGKLAAVGLIVTAVLPGLLPSQLVLSPPRTLLALPFVALSAGGGMDAILSSCRRYIALLAAPGQLRAEPSVRTHGLRDMGLRRWHVDALLASLALLLISPAIRMCVRQPESLGFAYSGLGGGLARVARMGTFSLLDETIVRGIMPPIDALGRDTITLFCPQISAEIWETSRELGVLRTRVRVASTPQSADLIVQLLATPDVVAVATARSEIAGIGTGAPWLTIEREKTPVLHAWLRASR